MLKAKLHKTSIILHIICQSFYKSTNYAVHYFFMQFFVAALTLSRWKSITSVTQRMLRALEAIRLPKALISWQISYTFTRVLFLLKWSHSTLKLLILNGSIQISMNQSQWKTSATVPERFTTLKLHSSQLFNVYSQATSANWSPMSQIIQQLNCDASCCCQNRISWNLLLHFQMKERKIDS